MVATVSLGMLLTMRYCLLLSTARNIPANKRKVVTMSEFDSVVSVLSFDDGIVDAHGVSLNSSLVVREELTRSTLDAYMTSMHIDQNNQDVIYYTTQTAIYSYRQTTKGKLLKKCAVYTCS